MGWAGRVGAATALVAAMAAGGIASGPGAGADTTLADCKASSLQAAVAAGGIVRYGQSCVVALTASITIPAGRHVEIKANGFSVQLDAGNAVRHFVVTGG